MRYSEFVKAVREMAARGGKAWAAGMTPAERSAQAREAAKVRWNGRGKEEG